MSANVRLGAVTLLTGVGAGLSGMCLALLLHAIQHLAYGYSLSQLMSHESFLAGVSAASGGRRVLAMLLCGLVAGAGWFALYRYGQPLLSIKQAVGRNGVRMPVCSTLCHALLQIITVALGSPLGREVAPREVGSLLAGWLGHYAELEPAECKVLVACGAGAGLAAVYNVPLGGAVFVLELLLVSFSPLAVGLAFATSSIAALVASIGLGNESQYVVPELPLSASLVMWAAVCGPLFGVAAWTYVWLTTKARAAAPRRSWKLPLFSVLNFGVVGICAVALPQLLGNGKGPAQLSFSADLTVEPALVLFALKVLFTVSSLRAGAEGGLLTPGPTNGALMAIALNGIWSIFWPGASAGACAIVGATAFLASSMSMPLTAIVLMLEFTHVGHDMLIPIVLAVAGSLCANRVCA
ncbi:H+/Cl- antiporter ClcA [Paraburkholderia unamae]|uniref:chloride channel protein n=1 Tax=Paraburkholderia unamae TaxID=219649 RepID=UPI000DC3D883|nr:chloride channel protein [Paraburkholderia unamae]RAR57153.1 H+/Cl- antiporter ClcA [Paraburkholderia unamae]